MPLLRFDEDITRHAKLHASKKGYLHKADIKFKKLSLRWCCIRHNILFVFESESCPKPLYSIFLEGAVCKPVEQDGLKQRGVTVSFKFEASCILFSPALDRHRELSTSNWALTKGDLTAKSICSVLAVTRSGMNGSIAFHVGSKSVACSIYVHVCATAHITRARVFRAHHAA